MASPRLCWNGIVKNEADKIVRCMESLLPHISCYVVADTGSTDLTPDLIRDFMNDHGIPGVVIHTEFQSFEQARNEALAAARNSELEFDYCILVDADMELCVINPTAFDNLTGPSYDMEQRTHSLRYMNRRLVHKKTTGWYVCPTHEYLNVPPAGAIDGAYFIDHADGSNRKDKFKRDIALLKPVVEKNPKDARAWFYLGQSYRDAKMPKQAANAYKKRVELGGWPEEQWNAQVNYAHCMYNFNSDEGEFVAGLLRAYEMRPTRAEPLFDLANHFRKKGDNIQACLFAERAMEIPSPKETLFISEWVYKGGAKEEFAISAFYDPFKRNKGYKVCNALSLDKNAFHAQRHLARSNMFYYIPTLKELAPTFQHQPVEFTAPTGYTAMNPSITSHGENLYCVVRTVNYTITPEGRYQIRAGDGSINDHNPIHTRNFLLRIGRELQTEVSREILMPVLPDPKYKLVIGCEDMRLFSYRGNLNMSATIRQLNKEGWCEQVRAMIFENGDSAQLGLLMDMPRPIKGHEKNWMPWVTKEHGLRFVYTPGVIVDAEGRTISSRPSGAYDLDHLRGGAQVVEYPGGGYLALVHEAHVRPDNRQRYYVHRFMVYNPSGTVRAVSLPFVFQDKQIEFAAGMAWMRDNLVVSYGVKDQEAKLGTLSFHDIEGLFHVEC